MFRLSLVTHLIFQSLIAVLLPALPMAAVTKTASQPTRDSAAITAIQNSLSAMGGSDGWTGVQDWTIGGTKQGLDGTLSAGLNKTFTWIGAGSEFLFQVTSKDGLNSFVSGYGTPARISNGIATSVNYHMARANAPAYIPGVLLAQVLNDTKYTLQYVGNAKLNGVAAIQVHISDDSDVVGSLVTPQEWYFDASSYLPLQVSFRLPANENAEDYLGATYAFSQFKEIGALEVPFQVLYTSDPLAAGWSISINSVAFNTGVPPSTFDAPKGLNK